MQFVFRTRIHAHPSLLRFFRFFVCPLILIHSLFSLTHEMSSTKNKMNTKQGEKNPSFTASKRQFSLQTTWTTNRVNFVCEKRRRKGTNKRNSTQQRILETCIRRLFRHAFHSREEEKFFLKMLLPRQTRIFRSKASRSTSRGMTVDA